MFQTVDNNNLGIQANRHEEDKNVIANIGSIGGIGGGGNIKNLLTSAKSAKFKKPNFVKANSRTDFFILGAKKAFIHL